MDRTASTPTTANYSPEEIQSDPTLNPVSSSQATEDDRQPAVILDEEAISSIASPVDRHSDGCDAYDAQNQIVAYDAQNQIVAVEPSMEVRWAN